jgi:hypothetical protein
MVEHAYDLRGRDRVLFIDAAARQGEPVHWQRVEASAGGPAISSHQCTPSSTAAPVRPHSANPTSRCLAAVPAR